MSVQIIINKMTALEAKVELCALAKMFSDSDMAVLDRKVEEVKKEESKQMELPLSAPTTSAPAETKKPVGRPAKKVEAKPEEEKTTAAAATAQETTASNEPLEETAKRLLKEVNVKKGIAAAVGLLKGFGAAKFSDVRVSDHEKFVETANALLEAK